MLRSFFVPLLATAALGIAACSAPADNTETETAPAAVETTAANAVTSGTFRGASDHITVGKASITGTEGNYKLVFAADFSLDGAPDPVVGFGNDGTYDAATKVGSLAQQTGAQTYALPASFDPATAGEVYVWCEQVGIPLGVATLS